jgi:hypothetical protein
MKKSLLLTLAVMTVPAVAFASAGIQGECSDCHTMHNSIQGKAVAQVGTLGGGSSTSTAPVMNLLKMDCIACHAMDPNGADKIVHMDGGSDIPQVMHADTTGDLAGGNFSYVGAPGTGNNRHGHNVKDLFAGGDDDGYGSSTAGALNNPPGMYHGDTTSKKFSSVSAFDNFTCAGAKGCHGTRSQMLTGATDTTTNIFVYQMRTGIAAISGAHHNSYDGAKSGANYAASGTRGAHDGAKVAAGYRFIPGLWAYGNETNRWQNNNGTDHNEYYGVQGLTTPGSGCSLCHITGTAGTGASSRMTYDSAIQVPNNSMSGFCSTCHGEFHSTGANAQIEGTGANGKSGAFLRHPSDFVIPNTSEYAAYTSYEITAPVARPTLASSISGAVTPGTDMVMCLSCHEAHGTPNDYMLRFDYNKMIAGNTAAADLGKGCLACHTSKGILPENR